MEKRKFPASQAEALRQGATYYFTGEPCKKGHISERFAKNRNCRECLRIRNRERTKKKDYWIDYGDDGYKEKKREYARKYYAKNKEKWTEGVKKRRQFEKFSKRAATQKDLLNIRRMKLEAQLLTIDTGRKHELDHVIPLIHDLVCGLHTAANCQVLSKVANRRKAARFDQDEQSRIQLEISRTRFDP